MKRRTASYDDQRPWRQAASRRCPTHPAPRGVRSQTSAAVCRRAAPDCCENAIDKRNDVHAHVHGVGGKRETVRGAAAEFERGDPSGSRASANPRPRGRRHRRYARSALRASAASIAPNVRNVGFRRFDHRRPPRALAAAAGPARDHGRHALAISSNASPKCRTQETLPRAERRA